MSGGYVYAITDGEYIKIGMTKLTAETRLRDGQTWNARELRILATWKTQDDPLALEQTVQRILRARHVRREWFDTSMAEVYDAFDAAGSPALSWRRAVWSLRAVVVRAQRWLVRGFAVVGAVTSAVVTVWLGVLLAVGLL